ncbi:adenylate/guanylate cyclase domain-containing protein [Streptomyces sp. NPDC093109]|uniref:adenylate/guanylate cyclase domain-containing protein n=1 Tax=Streptomyces sp. NPDC093109 TaxID=3154977 RepID=UPI00344F25C1
MAPACPGCHTRTAPGARFCSACGHALPPGPATTVGPGPEPVASRRTVTVLFCDMTGSTALSERLDPEALRHVMLRYFTRMRACVEDHGGTVEKFIGDAVMAVFGVPLTHEDDALRAVRAALDMRDSLTDLNAELRRELGTTVAVRIGVATGEVVATVVPGADQALVSGDTVNVAARLEQHAPSGQILVGAVTRALAGPAVEAEPVAPLSVKGKSRPVPAWRILRAAARPATMLRGGDSALVDRTAELDALLALHRRTAHDRTGRLVTLLGDPGVGKSRLARAYGREAVRQGALVTGTDCPPYGSPGPYAPLAALLEGLAPGLPGTGGPFRGRVAALLGGGEPASAAAALLDRLRRGEPPGTGAEEVHLALLGLLTALGRDRTVVAVLDDVQYAAPALLDAVAHLAGGLADAPVLLLCLARPELLDHAPRWSDTAPTGTRLPIPPLPKADCQDLVARLRAPAAGTAGGPPGDLVLHLAPGTAPGAPDAVTERIAERAEGNPLFVEQMVAMEREGGDPEAVPLSLRGLVAARLDRLPGAERELLGCAAVVGREFPLDHLRVVRSGEPGPDGRGDAAPPAALLAALVSRRIVEPVPEPPSGEPPSDAAPAPAPVPGGHRFTSPLIQEVVYAGLSRRLRAERHERLAAWLLAAGAAAGAAEPSGAPPEPLLPPTPLLPPPPSHPDHTTAGGHLERAFWHRHGLGLLDRTARRTGAAAVAQLTAAGAAALARGEVGWATDLLRRARAVDDVCAADAHADTVVRLRLRTELAEAQLATGHTERAVTAFHTVHTEAVRTGDAATAARVRLQLAYLEPGSPGFGTVLDAARESLAPLAEAGDDLGLARARLRIGQAHQSEGRHARAVTDFTAALRHAARAEAELERAGTVGAFGVSLWLGPEPVPAALRRCEELLVTDLDGRRMAQAALSCPMAVLLATRRRFPEARERLGLASRTLRDFGHVFAAPAVTVFAATVETLDGRWDTAETMLRGARTDLARLGDAPLHATATRDLVRALLEQGRAAQARALLEPAGGDLMAAAELHALQGRLLARAGDGAGARTHLRQALDAARTTESPLCLADVELDLAHALADLADRAGADPEGPAPATARAYASAAYHRYRAKGHLVGAARAQRLARPAPPARPVPPAPPASPIPPVPPAPERGP